MKRNRASVVLIMCALAGWCAVRGADIPDEVQQKLLNLRDYTVFDHLNYQVHGSEVTLTGAVVDPKLKQNATQAVQTIDGVTAVLNEIQVLPQSNQDNAIRGAEYQAIYGDPALGRYGDPSDPSIRIIVNKGQVTLEGIVANEGDKETTEVCANSIPGIAKVHNNLLIEQGVSE